MYWVPPIGVVDEARGRATPRDRHVERVEDELGPQVAGHRPAHDRPGERVDHDRDVEEARPGRDVGDVGDPQLVRAARAERSVDEVRCRRRAAVADRRPDRPPAVDALRRPATLSSSAASFSSPAAPIAQARVDCGSTETARTIRAARPVPQRSVIACSRFAARRSCSARADRPATPASTVRRTVGDAASPAGHSMHRIVRVARSQAAGVPLTNGAPQRAQVPSYFTRQVVTGRAQSPSALTSASRASP